jgi:hypothetical protein
MDDFVISNLQESRNEWCARLVSIFTPLVIEGIRSIFNEAWKLCQDTDEMNKYLMTFQNLLSRVPKWNSVIIEEERKRIIERSGCNYLEDLITCVHIIQLKVLTSIRVGNKQKKIDISIPKLDAFIHKVYINVARKMYMNVYLFEKSITALQLQKYGREMEVIVQECILTAIRESIPTEEIIRAYMDESIEREEEVTIERVEEPELVKGTEDSENNNTDKKEENDSGNKSMEEDKPPEVVPSIKNIDDEPVMTRLSFNDFDYVKYDDNIEEKVNAPKTIERLEEIGMERALQRKLEEEDDDNDRIKIDTGDNIDLGILDIFDLNGSSSSSSSNIKSKSDNDDLLLNDIVELF